MPDESLDQYVRDLRDAQPPNFAAYESDKTPALQRTHDGATSCRASHDVKDAPSGASVLRRYPERMLHMAIDACIQIGIGILTQIRNLLVYARDGVDDMLVYGFAKKRLGDFGEFANAVLERQKRECTSGSK